MKKTLILAVLLSSSLFANADDHKEAKRMGKEVTWKQVVKVNYKVGMTSKALKIIKDYYHPASVKAGTPVPETVVRMQTGDIDLLVIWRLPGGVNDLTWETSPDNIKWQKAFVELAGSEEKAKEIREEYLSYLEHVEMDIGIHRPM